MDKPLESLKNLPYFKTENLKTLTGYSDNTVKTLIARKIKSKKFIRLKNGLFVTSDYFYGIKDFEAISYAEFIANVIKIPSYLSSEYVLSRYGVITEGVYAFTSVTRGRPYVISNSLGKFVYKNIKEELYDGYETFYFRNLSYYRASLAKALFDFFYYKTNFVDLGIKGVNIADEFRLNMEPFSKRDRDKILYWAKMTKNIKLHSIFINLFDHGFNN